MQNRSLLLVSILLLGLNPPAMAIVPTPESSTQQFSGRPGMEPLTPLAQAVDPPSTLPQLQEADRLEQQVIEFYQQGRYQDGITLAQEVVKLRESVLGDHPQTATALNNLALLYGTVGRYSEAELLYERSLRIRETQLGSEHLDTATSLNNLAELYRETGRYAEAEPLYHRSLAIREAQLGTAHPDTATSLNNLAALYQSMGRYGESEQLYQQALAIVEAQQGANPLDTAMSLNNLAELYREMGRYTEAEPLLKRSLAIIETQLGADHPYTARSLNNLAFLYDNLGRYTEAEPLYQRALGIIETQLGADHPYTALALNNLAGLYEAMARYSDAEPLYSRALTIRETQLGSNHPDTATSLNNLAGLYDTMGRYREAEPLYQRALGIMEAQLGSNHPTTATFLNNLAGLYETMGRYSDAEPLYTRSLAILETQLGTDHPKTAQSLNNLALFYQTLGRYDEAEPLYQRSVQIYTDQLGENHPSTALVLNNLGGLYENSGRYRDAELLYQRSLEIRETQLGVNHPDTATSLKNLAVLRWAQARFPESLALLERGLAIEETNILQNITTLTEAEQRAYLNTVNYTEDLIVSLHLQQFPTNPQASATALTTILRRKGRILDTLSNTLQRLRANAKPEDLERLNQISQLHTQLTTLLNQGTTQAQVEQIQAEIDQLQKELAQNNPELNRSPVPLESIRALLPAQTALVEFFQYRPYNPLVAPDARYGAPHYAAYVLTPEGEVVGLDLGPASFIDERLKAFRDRLTDPGSTGRLTQISKIVYQVLIQPLQPYLGSTQHLLLSPDGNLNLIPFAALQNDQGQYLLEQYQLTTLSSGRDLLAFQRHYPAAQPPVIVANPSYNAGSDATAPQLVASARTRGLAAPEPRTNPVPLKASTTTELRAMGLPSTWSDLPGTAREAALIGPKLPLSLPLTGDQATEGAVKAVQSPSLLHFATHGFFLPGNRDHDNPLVRSGLILAGANLQDASRNQGEDGVLTALEVSGLDLRGTQLVVMSACDTGRGDVANGEGVYGLRRAFTLAGAESQLFSLWEVNDWATQALLTRYYDYILAGQGRSEAWRQTQLDMLQGRLDKTIDSDGFSTITTTAHPNYWAAFVPSGHWQPLESLSR